MINREITEYLIKWKNNNQKLPLVIRGARQVGKTFIVDYFARSNYKNYVYINFERDVEMKSAFEGNLNVEDIIQRLKFLNPKYNFVPHETLIFFDEIQKGGNCRTALKFFAEDKRFDIISSGSLLGLHHSEVNSFPVGYVENLELQSLNFKEFCKAQGIEDSIIEMLKKCFDEKTKVDEVIHNKMLEYFEKYIVVGGMPQVVNKYIETNDFEEVSRVKKDILMLYRDDVAKYARESEKEKILACFDSIPRHLAKDYKKFKYAEVEKKGSSRKYGGALEFLYDAGIINYCYNVNRIEFPFEGYVDDKAFKVYMKDTGLLITMLGNDIVSEIMNGNIGIYKGAIYENIVAEILSKLEKKLYYYEKNSSLEIDFLINYNNSPTLLEVKSSENTKAKSVKTLLDRNIANYAIKLSKKNLSYSDKIYNLPIYMAMFL